MCHLLLVLCLMEHLCLSKQIEKATINFGIGEIPCEVYYTVKREKGKELDETDAEIRKLEATSNHKRK